MKASEARELTRSALDAQTGVIAGAVAQALARIKDQAGKGRSAVSDPVQGLAYGMKQAAYEHIKMLGYKVEYSGDQRDGDFWTVSW